MPLTERQKKHLRGLAHTLKPAVHIGGAGVTPAVLTELERTLDHHELVKIRVRLGDRDQRDRAINQLVRQTDAELIKQIGNTAILYRGRDEDSRILLP